MCHLVTTSEELETWRLDGGRPGLNRWGPALLCNEDVTSTRLEPRDSVGRLRCWGGAWAPGKPGSHGRLWLVRES